MKTRKLPVVLRNLVVWTSALAFGALAQTTSLPETSGKNTGTADTPAVDNSEAAAQPTNATPSVDPDPLAGPFQPLEDREVRTVVDLSSPARTAQVPVALSYWAREMAKLAQAGIDDAVQFSFIDNAAGTFSLGAEQIIYLSDIGISSDVISAMLQHDFELASGLRAMPATITPSSDILIEFISSSRANLTTNREPASITASVRPQSTASDSTVPPPATEPGFEWLDYTDLELAVAEAAAFESRSAKAQQATLYSVREPHPVRVTPPILIFRASGRVPNVYLLEISP